MTIGAAAADRWAARWASSAPVGPSRFAACYHHIPLGARPIAVVDPHAME